MIAEQRLRTIEEVDEISKLEAVDSQQLNRLMDFLIDHTDLVASSAKAGNSPFDTIGGKKQIKDLFYKVLEKIKDLDLKEHQESQYKVALLLIAIFHHEDHFYLIKNGYARFETIKKIVKNCLKLKLSPEDPTVKFLQEIQKLMVDEEDTSLIKPGEILDSTSGYAAQMVEKTDEKNIRQLTTVFFTKEFAQYHPEQVKRLLEILAEKIEQANEDELEELMLQIDWKQTVNTIAIMNRKEHEQGKNESIGKIASVFVKFLDKELAYKKPAIVIKALELLSIFSRHLEIQTVAGSIGGSMQILIEALKHDDQDANTSFHLINANLGYILKKLAPENSPLTNDFATKDAADYDAETRNNLTNLSQLLPIAKLSISKLMELRPLANGDDENLSNPYTDAISYLESLIRQSPDLFNPVSSDEVKKYVDTLAINEDPLSKVQGTVATWLKLITESLNGSDEGELGKENISFLLGRIDIFLFSGDADSVLSQKIDAFSKKAGIEQDENSGLLSEWEQLRTEIEAAVGEFLATPLIERLSEIIGLRAESLPQFSENLRRLSSSLSTEVAEPNLITWMMDFSKMNKNKPDALQVLSGIILSPMTDDSKNKILLFLIKSRSPVMMLDEISRTVISKLIAEQRIIEAELTEHFPEEMLENL